MNSSVVKISDAALSKNVDALGLLNAEISALKKRSDLIKDKLIASGYPEIFGKSYKAVIVPKVSVRLDSKLVKAKLSPADIKACSKSSESISVSLYDL